MWYVSSTHPCRPKNPHTYHLCWRRNRCVAPEICRPTRECHTPSCSLRRVVHTTGPPVVMSAAHHWLHLTVAGVRKAGGGCASAGRRPRLAPVWPSFYQRRSRSWIQFGQPTEVHFIRLRRSRHPGRRIHVATKNGRVYQRLLPVSTDSITRMHCTGATETKSAALPSVLWSLHSVKSANNWPYSTHVYRYSLFVQHLKNTKPLIGGLGSC